MSGNLTIFDGLRQSIDVIPDTQVRARALKKVTALEESENRQRAVEGIGDLVRLAYGSALLNKALLAFLPAISIWIRDLSKN